MRTVPLGAGSVTLDAAPSAPERDRRESVPAASGPLSAVSAGSVLLMAGWARLLVAGFGIAAVWCAVTLGMR